MYWHKIHIFSLMKFLFLLLTVRFRPSFILILLDRRQPGPIKSVMLLIIGWLVVW